MRGTSIFRRLLFSYLTVLIFGIGLLTLLLSLTLQHFLVGQKERALLQQADAIIASLPRQEGASGSRDPRAVLPANIRADLLVIQNTPAVLQPYRQLARRVFNPSDIHNLAVVKRLEQGKRIQIVGKFAAADKQSLVTVGVPITSGSRVVGALILQSPVQEIEINRIIRLILWVAAGIALLAVLSIYFISRRISQPLIQMSGVARAISEGNFQARVKVEARDEVGQLGESLNEMALRLEQLETMRKDLITNVSHELRTPLTSVKGFVQGIVEGLIPHEQHRRYLETVYQELDRLHLLVNDMLDLSTIESGRLTLDKKVVRWSTLVDSVLDSIAVRAEEKRIRLHAEEQTGERLRVVGDPERLKQVLFNLLDNALRHTPEGGEISVLSQQAGGELEVKVADTGDGIAADKLNRIWERFYTEETSRASRKNRSGLGLTITRQLVELMDGRIEVQSEPGRGTVFTIRLPAPKA